MVRFLVRITERKRELLENNYDILFSQVISIVVEHGYLIRLRDCLRVDMHKGKQRKMH